MSWFSGAIMDNLLGFNPPKKPAAIITPKVNAQEVVSAQDSVRKKKRTATNLAGDSGTATLGAAALYGI